MTDLSTANAGIEAVQSRLAAMEQALTSGAATLEEVRQYFKLATLSGRIDQARRCFDRLRQQHPGDPQILGLYISVCLQQGDDHAAMPAIETLAGKIKPSDQLLDAALAVRKRLGPVRIKEGAAHSISLCMIARDESAFLGSCLDGVKSLVDEIVLVDTGSEDRSADIGRIFGAQVYHFEWCNDFSAARNFGLSKATGRWILVLDADEAIAPVDFEAIRGLVGRQENRVSAFAVETRNYCYTANAVGWRANDGCYPCHEAGLGWFPSTKVRLFRNQSDIRFHFPVHERIEPSLKETGINMAECSIPVHHYGHLNATRNLQKARKYYELGFAKLEEMGSDLAAIRELAVQAGQLEQWEEAIVLWERLRGLRPDYPEALINLASAHWQLGQYQESLEWSEKAVAEDTTLKEAHFNEALSYLMMGKFTPAQTILEKLLLKHSDYMAAGFMLSVAYACAGQTDRAHTIIRNLRQTAAKSALPAAFEDVRLRLQRAGLAHAVKRVDHVFEKVLNEG